MRGILTEEEKQNMPKITKELLLRIFSYLKPYIPQFLLVFVTIIISSVIGLLPSILTGRIVDEALVGKNMTLLIQLLLLAFATLTVSRVIGAVEDYINAWISCASCSICETRCMTIFSTCLTLSLPRRSRAISLPE